MGTTFEDMMNRYEKTDFYNLKNEFENLDIEELKDGVAGRTTERVVTPEFKKISSGFVTVEHGWSGQDYVWHVSPTTRKWKLADNQIYYLMAKILSEVVPEDRQVRLYPPYADWDIKEFTAKAENLKSAWNVNEDQLVGVTEKLLSVFQQAVR